MKRRSRSGEFEQRSRSRSKENDKSKRSRSRSKENDKRKRSRSKSGENAKDLCQICKKSGLNHIRCADCDLCCPGPEGHAQHIAGHKHKIKVGLKDKKSGNESENVEMITDETGKPRPPPEKPTSAPKVAQFGKRICSWCKKPVLGDEHFHCDTCNICCQGHQAFEQHILGKAHALKFVKQLPEAKPSEEPKVVPPDGFFGLITGLSSSPPP